MEITDKLIGGLFKYMYGMSSKEQEEYLAKLLVGKSRRKAKPNPIFSTKGVYRELDHLKRFHASGRSNPNPLDYLHDGTPDAFKDIPKAFEFTGKLVCVPITFGAD